MVNIIKRKKRKKGKQKKKRKKVLLPKGVFFLKITIMSIPAGISEGSGGINRGGSERSGERDNGDDDVNNNNNNNNEGPSLPPHHKKPLRYQRPKRGVILRESRHLFVFNVGVKEEDGLEGRGGVTEEMIRGYFSRFGVVESVQPGSNNVSERYRKKAREEEEERSGKMTKGKERMMQKRRTLSEMIQSLSNFPRGLALHLPLIPRPRLCARGKADPS